MASYVSYDESIVSILENTDLIIVAVHCNPLLFSIHLD